MSRKPLQTHENTNTQRYAEFQLDAGGSLADM
jgi:hypothetical protein